MAINGVLRHLGGRGYFWGHRLWCGKGTGAAGYEGEWTGVCGASDRH